MSAHPHVTPMPSPLSSATLGKVRRMLVARLTPEVLNPFDRTPEREASVRRTIVAILEDPEVEIAPTQPIVAAIEAAVCGLGPLQTLVDEPDVSDILVNDPAAIFVERDGRLEPFARSSSATSTPTACCLSRSASAGRRWRARHTSSASRSRALLFAGSATAEWRRPDEIRPCVGWTPRLG